jgi:hypothetical protein
VGKKSRAKRERRLGTFTIGEGSRQRTVDLRPAVAEIIKVQEAAFFQKFGRPMGPEDPIFFDPDADTPQPFPEDRYERDFNEAIDKAAATGMMRPEIVYATKRTGLIVTAENWDTLLPEDRAAWNEAINEYFEKIATTPAQ